MYGHDLFSYDWVDMEVGCLRNGWLGLCSAVCVNGHITRLLEEL